MFLIELVIAILVFAACAAISMRVFAGAHVMTQESAALSRSVMEAESAAECYKAARGDLAETARIYGGELTGEGTLAVSFDGTWSRTMDAAAYLLTIAKGEGGRAEVRVASIPAAGGEPQTIYAITVKAVM